MIMFQYLRSCLASGCSYWASFRKNSGNRREKSASMTDSDSIFSEFPEYSTIPSITSYGSEKAIFIDNNQHCNCNNIDKSTNVFNKNYSKLEIDTKNCDHLDTCVKTTQTDGTKICEKCFFEENDFKLRLDSEFENWYMVDVIARIQQSKTKMADSKETETEGKDDSSIVHDLVMNKFSDSLDRLRNRSLKRRQKRLERFPIEHVQNEGHKTEQKISDGGNGTVIRSENCKAKESPINSSKTEEKKKNILPQKRQQKTEISDKYPSASPKFKSTPISFNSNEVNDNLEDSTSIGDSDSSLLLSRRTPIFSTPYSRMIYYNDSEKDTPLLQKHKYNNKKDELLKSYLVNHETMVQTIKAIDFCKDSKKLMFTPQHVELERLLLISNLRSEAAAKELASLHYNSIYNYESNNSGSVFVKNIALPGKESKKHKKIATWYVCTVSCGTEIFGTAASQANANGDVVFEEEFEIKTRSHNFEITITIYGMVLPIHKKKSTFLRFNPLNATNTYIDCFRTLTAMHKTSLLPCSKIVIDLKDLKKTTFQLPQISKHLNLLGILKVSLRAEPKLSDHLKSFVYVGKKYSSRIFWNRLWCCLEGKTIKLYNYPQDEKEDRYLEVLELDGCVSPAIKLLDIPRTLLIELIDKSEKKPAVREMFLSTDLVHETEKWLKCINRVFTSLESWNSLKC